MLCKLAIMHCIDQLTADPASGPHFAKA
jgi:hypothetical protein